MNIIGLDYSLSCPAMCVMEKPFIQNCRFYYLTSVHRDTGSFAGGKINGKSHKLYTSEQERYDDIAEYFLNNIPTYESPRVFIEDYSFGSKGKVFHLAENCGVLKHKLYEVGYTHTAIPPTVVKKFATGSGAAKKEKMYDCFMEETGLDLVKLLFPHKKLGNPVTDIVDSFYIAKWGYYSSVETKVK